jgi:unsaturated chondroitin disaccharide hydrolase
MKSGFSLIITSHKYRRFILSMDALKNQMENALQLALMQIDANLECFQSLFPDAASDNLIYQPVENVKSWTHGFWTGMLWLAYEFTGNPKYRAAAEMQIETFRKRINEQLGMETHDLGFLYTLSCISAYKLTGNEEAKQIALKAADQLTLRYKEKGQFIQAWGSIHDPENYRFIIDCYMNLPLLFWASEMTGDPKYREIAHNHASTATKFIIRSDGSTYHTYYFDPDTGQPVKGVTRQGYSDDSCWSRGQAWGIYGLALAYHHVKDEWFLSAGKNVTEYFLNHLPSDNLPYWDLIFTSGNEPRDSSAASIAVGGLMEWVNQLDERYPMKPIYEDAWKRIMKSMIDKFASREIAVGRGLLLHGVYDLPRRRGVDEFTIFGDYFYMESLVRGLKNWNLYW